jgi:glycosyltransferase involved in cell wall biosynthesis
MSAPVNVVQVVLSLDCGGIEHLVVDLVRQGHQHGQQVTVVCLERPGTLAPQAEAAGARVVCIHKRPGLKLRTIGQMTAVLRQLRPDVVHTHTIAGLLYAGPAARAVGVPVVVHTEHLARLGIIPTLGRRLRLCLLMWLAARFAARFFCVSEETAAEIQAYHVVTRQKVYVVANGINTARFRERSQTGVLRRFLGIPSGAPVIGTIGRLTEQKRQDLLIRAFARVRQQVPQAHLLLVGDGPCLGELHQLTARLDVGECVHFTGYQAQRERYLQAMDLFVQTSQIEGMPLAVLEAWAAGVPVIGSRVKGLRDLIDDGRTGILSPFGDHAALAAALCRLLSDPGLARQLSEAARHRVESSFTASRMFADYQRHYFELLDESIHKKKWLSRSRHNVRSGPSNQDPEGESHAGRLGQPLQAALSNNTAGRPAFRTCPPTAASSRISVASRTAILPRSKPGPAALDFKQ